MFCIQCVSDLSRSGQRFVNDTCRHIFVVCQAEKGVKEIQQLQASTGSDVLHLTQSTIHSMQIKKRLFKISLYSLD